MMQVTGDSYQLRGNVTCERLDVPPGHEQRPRGRSYLFYHSPTFAYAKSHRGENGAIRKPRSELLTWPAGLAGWLAGWLRA